MYIDLFICVLMVWAVYNGWRSGFIKEVFSSLGIVAGLILAALLYSACGEDFLAVTGTETNMVLSIGMFFILWILLPLALGLVANILTRAVKGMQLGLPNSLLGTLFSVGKFAILMSCVLNMMARLNILDEQKMNESHLLEPAMNILPFIDHQVEAHKAGDGAKSDTTWVDFDRDKSSVKEDAQDE